MNGLECLKKGFISRIKTSKMSSILLYLEKDIITYLNYINFKNKCNLAKFWNFSVTKFQCLLRHPVAVYCSRSIKFFLLPMFIKAFF